MIDLLKNFISLFFVVPLVLFLGIYLSIKLKWMQFSSLSEGVKSIFQSKSSGSKGSLSSFSALSAVLGGNLGTGNIAGVAVALSTGGPGSLFWMWVMAIFGAIVKFAGCYLGVTHRINHSKYGWLGGPMYYLSNHLGWHKSAKLYCLFTIISAFTVGNLVQVNSIALPVTSMGGSIIWLSIAITAVVAMVLVGGVKFFSAISATIVPFMASIYLGACLLIMVIFHQEIIPALHLIIHSAFNSKPLLGGFVGFLIMDAVRVGFDRGLFATDAGIGLAAILHSQVDSNEQSVKDLAKTQGLITMVAPIIVMVICSMTGLVLIVTGAWQVAGAESTNMCIAAFQLGFNSENAAYLVIFTMVLFSFTTILTWAHCAERALIFLADEKWLLIFKWCFILVIPIGAFCGVHFVWTIADIAINLMLLVNIIAIIKLSKDVIGEKLYIKDDNK